jgi:hypothetical protein
LPGNQHDSEASFVSHHVSVSFGTFVSGTVSIIGRMLSRELKQSVSCASFEEPVIVPAIERWISQLAGQDRAVLPYRHESESCRGG